VRGGHHENVSERSEVEAVQLGGAEGDWEHDCDGCIVGDGAGEDGGGNVGRRDETNLRDGKSTVYSF
jgi:hypothetical protein